MSPQIAARPAPFYGRTVVVGAFLLAVLGWGLGFYGPPIYLQAVIDRTGWPLGFVSSMMTLHFLCGVPIVAQLPRLYARYRLPLVTRIGALSLAAGVLGWSLAAQPWQLVVAALLTGCGWVTMGPVAVTPSSPPGSCAPGRLRCPRPTTAPASAAWFSRHYGPIYWRTCPSRWPP